MPHAACRAHTFRTHSGSLGWFGWVERDGEACEPGRGSVVVMKKIRKKKHSVWVGTMITVIRLADMDPSPGDNWYRICTREALTGSAMRAPPGCSYQVGW